MVFTAAVVAGIMPAPAHATTLPAPTVKFFTEYAGTTVKVNPVSGAAKYYVYARQAGKPDLRVGQLGSTGVSTTPIKVAGQMIRVRAVTSSGAQGLPSEYVLVVGANKDEWRYVAALPRTREGLSAYAKATANYAIAKAPACAADKAFAAAYDAAQAQAKKASLNLGAASALAVSEVYEKLYKNTFTSNCAQITSVLKFNAQFAAAVWATNNTLSYSVESYYNRQSYLPDFCTVYFNSYGIEGTIKRPTKAAFSQRPTTDGHSKCRGEVRRWF